MNAATTLLNSIAAATGSTDKNEVINIAMAMLVKSGVKASEAMDLLFGDGAYKKFASEMYQALRAA